MTKTAIGNFFEDFKLGQVLEHATPRTVREADLSLYQGLTGSRFPIQSSQPFALRAGLPSTPADDLMVFHIVFGKSVPDISVNAVANLGYAQGEFTGLVYPGDTLTAKSTVIGLKENSNGKTGVVYVRTQGLKNETEAILDYVRWVMVRKEVASLPSMDAVIPELLDAVPTERLKVPSNMVFNNWRPGESGSRFGWEDYEVGEKIDHSDGMGVMEAEHRLATRLYQNTARVHFNDHTERQGRLGATIVYGGVIISTARALSFNGLANAAFVLAINGGRHVNPCVAGDTVYAWSEVLDKASLSDQAGALRLRLVATKNEPCENFPLKDENGKYFSSILLDFDYWVLIPKRVAFENF